MSREWTPQQRNAIYATDGSILVSAAAGSGKTAVLTERICHLITQCNVGANEILALTFTNKAAGEMAERLSKLMNVAEEDIYMSTYKELRERMILCSEIG